MNLTEFIKTRFQSAYLFDPKEYGRIFAFVDFANVRKWARAFWPLENEIYLTREIDIEKLSKLIGYVNSVKRFFYYGHYKRHPNLTAQHPLNIKWRDSVYRIDRARKAGFTVRTKEIKEISTFDEEGKFVGKISKCNFDVEITMDVLQKIEKYDTVFLWSGDSDFHFLLQDLKRKGKKVIIACARDFVSEELNQHSDLFIPADPLKDHLEFRKIQKTNPPRP